MLVYGSVEAYIKKVKAIILSNRDRDMCTLISGLPGVGKTFTLNLLKAEGIEEVLDIDDCGHLDMKSERPLWIVNWSQCRALSTTWFGTCDNMSDVLLHVNKLCVIILTAQWNRWKSVMLRRAMDGTNPFREYFFDYAFMSQRQYRRWSDDTFKWLRTKSAKPNVDKIIQIFLNV